MKVWKNDMEKATVEESDDSAAKAPESLVHPDEPDAPIDPEEEKHVDTTGKCSPSSNSGGGGGADQVSAAVERLCLDDCDTAAAADMSLNGDTGASEDAPSAVPASSQQPSQKSYDYLLKFLLVGDSDVGKQEIISHLEDGINDSPFCSSDGAGMKEPFWVHFLGFKYFHMDTVITNPRWTSYYYWYSPARLKCSRPISSLPGVQGQKFFAVTIINFLMPTKFISVKNWWDQLFT